MDSTAPQRAERAALCDLLLELGPGAPTLCEGWRTLDLAVHLVIRERDPIAAPGILLGGPFAGLLRSHSERAARRPFADLVRTVRSGPPPWLAPLDPVVNLAEMFVHHEDVRRGGGDTTPRAPAATAGLDDALWRLLSRSARLLARRLGPVGLDLQRPDGRTVAARPARDGSPAATLTGEPGELVLYLMGRTAAAHVALDGPEAAVRAVRDASFGI